MTPLDCHRVIAVRVADLLRLKCRGFHADSLMQTIGAAFTGRDGVVYDVFGYTTRVEGWFFVRGHVGGTHHELDELHDATAERVFTRAFGGEVSPLHERPVPSL